MRHLAIATVALLATAVAGLSPVSAQPILRHACVQNEYGRVICGPVVNFYPNGWYNDQFYYPVLPVGGGYCPPGTVLGVSACIPWRAPLGSKCPPNMTLREDGFCRRYSDRF